MSKAHSNIPVDPVANSRQAIADTTKMTPGSTTNDDDADSFKYVVTSKRVRKITYNNIKVMAVRRRVVVGYSGGGVPVVR